MANLPPAAPLDTIQLLTMCGINSEEARNGIRDDMMTAPGGIGHLNEEDADGIHAACSTYAKRTIANGRFNVNRVQQKRLIALMYWVQDQKRLGEAPDFPATFNQEMVITAIMAANDRHHDRINQAKKGDSILSNDFQVKLQFSGQWERWEIELESTLRMIIGANGIALNYVTRENDEPDRSPQDSWEEQARLSAPHTGAKFKTDALTVHNIITRNISEASDAYTYIKPRIKKNNGRLDIIALKERYENKAMHETCINEAKKVLQTITYRNERAMKFEKFVANFQKAIDDLERYGRGMHDADIVDMIWPKMCNPELASYVVSLKVHHQHQRRGFREILQDIATQVPTIANTAFSPRGVAELGTGGAIYDNDKQECPAEGAHLPDGTLFTGSYPYKQWHHHSVKPYQDEIRAIREQSSRKPAHDKWDKKKTYHSQKKRAAELRTTISELESTKRRLIMEVNTQETEEDKEVKFTTPSNKQAGTAFGGRAEKAKGSNK